MTFTGPIPGPLVTKTQASSGPTAETKKMEKAARQFETQLLTSVLTALESSIGASGDGASEQYKTMATQGLASAWAAAGGIGIARLISHALAHSTTPDLPSAPPSALPDLPLTTLPPVR